MLGIKGILFNFDTIIISVGSKRKLIKMAHYVSDYVN